VAAHNARLGLVLFFVYLALYGGFVAVAVVDPPVMGRPAVAGVNLAVCWGFGLIVGAFVLALVYMALCRPEAAEPPLADVADLTEGQVAEAAEGEGTP
jgi:uncharacterized membrane protein (DUF485 family)